MLSVLYKHTINGMIKQGFFGANQELCREIVYVMQYIYSKGKYRLLPGTEVKRFFMHETASTMNAARLVSKSFPGKLISVRTDFQSCGKGRTLGRSWESLPGENLLCTYVIPEHTARGPLQLMPLLFGAAVAGVLESMDLADRLSVKWPNDLLAGERKICGILCEKGDESLYAGIGLNVNQAEFRHRGKRDATSLFLETGSFHDIEALEIDILKEILSLLGQDAWLQAVGKKLYRLGRNIEFSTGVTGSTRVITGVLSGIAEDGALIIRTGKGEEHFYSGEILSMPGLEI